MDSQEWWSMGVVRGGSLGPNLRKSIFKFLGYIFAHYSSALRLAVTLFMCLKALD